jgi:hypothetical protein
MVRAVGPEHTILSTDLGQLHNAAPWEGMRVFIQLMLDHGITADEIGIMVKRNPAFALGLPGSSRPKGASHLRSVPKPKGHSKPGKKAALADGRR